MRTKLVNITSWLCPLNHQFLTRPFQPPDAFCCFLGGFFVFFKIFFQFWKHSHITHTLIMHACFAFPSPHRTYMRICVDDLTKNSFLQLWNDICQPLNWKSNDWTHPTKTPVTWWSKHQGHHEKANIHEYKKGKRKQRKTASTHNVIFMSAGLSQSLLLPPTSFSTAVWRNKLSPLYHPNIRKGGKGNPVMYPGKSDGIALPHNPLPCHPHACETLSAMK